MFYRCLNSMFDYCDGKPTFEGGAPDESDTTALSGRKCTRDYKTCPQRKLLSELHISTPVEKPVKVKAKRKGKGKE